jgi:tRNA dimethylallyltransferase
LSTASKSSGACILLFGPTAVGKTELINEIFSRGFEIISADALQVYRKLDIGTAKPSKQERHEIPHHLIDIRDPSEGFNVGDFVREADACMRGIRSRGRIPLISGGTAFYLIRFLYGLPETPPADPPVRAELEARFKAEGTSRLLEELAAVDPASRRSIHPNDTYRILRALEVYYSSGRPLSEFRVPGRPRRGLNPLVLGLHREREELYRRIDERVDRMWEAGLVEEVRRLIDEGYREKDPGLKGIGYREFFDMRRLGEWTLSGVKEEIKKNSRRYAKRQQTFFRKIEEAKWIHPDHRDSLSGCVDHYINGLQQGLNIPENRGRLESGERNERE